MAEEENIAEKENTETTRPEFPIGRIKKIMKIDKDINKITSEAMFLVSCSTELFLRFLADNSAKVAVEKKRKTIKLDHIRTAVKRHQPTSDFLLDSLPQPVQSEDRPATDRTRSRPNTEKPLPVGTRRIDDFFSKPAEEGPVQINND
ncbi:nuclear transcription factor Y subunit C-5 [Pistacia vera]|uniref:nuclear transcription factor Y subunit C-5 n=1 Tax=Pistacia vera TaxID=55513 RepID=UPI0012633788|nr:nuclear transcription factor Y subunit C-5 [Pistacia vera]XP_031272830.1 nuclear transcription factor Y subunit C-5 [Pistacia vera]